MPFLHAGLSYLHKRFESASNSELCKMKKRILLHAAFWLAYFAGVTYVEFAWATASFKDLSVFGRLWIAVKVELSMFPAKMFLCYSVLYGPLRQSLTHQQSRVTAILQVSAAIAVATILYRVSVKWIAYPWAYRESPDSVILFEGYRLVTSLFDLVLVLGFAMAFKLYRMQLQGKEREKQLVKEKLETELQFLRSQTNPHFLFNTLNNIYALTRRQSGPAAEMVLQLSGLLRFMLYECSKPRIPIADEIKVAEGLIALEKLRYSERLQVELNTDLDDPSELIAPLILLPFIENAFKHGAGESRFETRIGIRITLNNGVLELEVRNDKEPEDLDKSQGLGLQNVRRQLELLYPSAHDLYIDNQPEAFLARLRVNLRVYENVAMPYH